jgi:hypothetical protein
VTDPYRAERQALVAAVTSGSGQLPADTRAAIVDRARGRPVEAPIPKGLRQLTDLVARHAPAIEDADVAAPAREFGDEAVLETIVASSLGASLVRLERVDELLEDE